MLKLRQKHKTGGGIKHRKLLVKHNKSELYEWGELFHSPVSEAGGGGGLGGGQPLKSWDRVTHRD